MPDRCNTRVRLALCALLLSLCSGLVSSANEQRPVHYVVPNDTLWNLANRYLNAPQRWPELWQLNPQIRNPNLIYPGERIFLATHDGNAGTSAQSMQTTALDKGPVSRASPEQATHPIQSVRPKTLPAGLMVDPTDEQPTPAVPARSVATAKLDTGNQGFRSLTVPAPSAVQAQPVYVDRLIDASTPNDSFEDLGRRSARAGLLTGIDHSMDLLTLYRDDDINFDASLDYGLQYSARMSTRNWGQLRLNLIALDEFGDFEGYRGPNNGLFQRQSGIARFSVEQYNLPLTEQVTMDNIVGMHRQRRYNPFRERPNLINYRFGAAEPDVFGITSQMKLGRSGIGVSIGELGQTRGTLLPGFRKTEGRIQRGQFTHVLDRHALSAELWQTEDQTLIDNRRGYRLAYDHILGTSTVLSFSSVASGSQQALLFGGSTETDLSKHDFGAYYFEPDIIWLDNRIGDDNAGAFYRFHTQNGPRSLGASVELRRDGLEGSTAFQADTAFVTLSMATRLNRRSALSTVYGYRQVEVESGSQASYQEHTLRSYITLAHRGNTRSNLGVLTRVRSQEQELELSYGLARDMDDGSSLEIASRLRHQFAATDEADEVSINANWQKQFSQGTHLGLGLGYAYGNSRLASNRGLTGYLSIDQPLTPRLGVSLQLDYSRDRSDYEDPNLADTLFTSNSVEDDDFVGLRSFSALLKLSYQLNGSGQPSVLRGTGFAQGSGRIQGFVFVDANGDGERQPDESGVPGITVFLNSVHPVVTDARGAYSFPSVSPGQHFLFVDETTLPLPWTLKNSEYTGLDVHLRRTTQLDIPLSTITLAEAQ